MNRRPYGGPGPLILAGFDGTSLPGTAADALRDGRLAGVFLRRQNIASADQTRALAREVQSLAAGGLPAIVAIDEEGGLVSHLAHVAPAAPAPMAIAAAGADPRAIAAFSARALRRLGINTNFAPVCDVNTNPINPVIGTRSFGADSAAVSRFAAGAIAGFHAEGVFATAKHFPGHGMTGADSHVTLPVVQEDEGALGLHLAPFRGAVRAGVDLVMTAHVAYPALEVSLAARAGESAPAKPRPATLSRPVLRALLRGEIGFEGVVVSDAFEMAGLAGEGGPREIAERGTEAGVDLWLVTEGLEKVREMELGLARFASDPGGRFLVQQAGARVNRLRGRAARDFAEGDVVDPEAVRAYGEIAMRAVRVAQGAEQLPLKAERPLFVLPEGWPPHLVVDVAAASEAFRGLWPCGEVLSVPKDAGADAIEALRARDADAIVFGSCSRGRVGGGQRALAEAAVATGKPVFAAALLDPPDMETWPRVAAVVATFGARPENIRALLATLAGRPA
jgi:beta-N-acetylhexosaminidase